MLKMRIVPNKILCQYYPGCKNCIFIYNCRGDHSRNCYIRNIKFREKYYLIYIYVKDEKSSE